MSLEQSNMVERRNLKTLINLAYKCFLFREVDNESLGVIVDDMASGVYDIEGLIDGLIQSEEYENRISNLVDSQSLKAVRNENYRVSQVLAMMETL